VDGKAACSLAGSTLIEVEIGLDASGRLTAHPSAPLFDFTQAGLRAAEWSPMPERDGFVALKPLATDERSEIVVGRCGLRLAPASPPDR
jgi:hypothetical protein